MTRTDHTTIADKLVAKTGRWVKVATYGSTSSADQMAREVRDGKRPAYRALQDGLSVTIRNHTEVWARYDA